MHDRGWILAGLLLFLAAITYPVWHAAEVQATSQPPALVLPAHEKECVAPISYMRTSHMKLLLDWRTSVVRDNQRKYVSFDGKVYDINLTGTCMKCHEKKGFCDRCHNYAGVGTPYCWNCHVDPSLAEAKRP
jgi:[DsrC]-trisulfide reductase subunit J